MRFIGSKLNMLENIDTVVKENIKDNSSVFCDIFSGTASVGEHFKKKFIVQTNDKLYFSYVIQLAKIQNNTIPNFKRLKEYGITNPIQYLETQEIQIEDTYFITHNYSPYKNCERMYFTVENASRIDFIRQTIELWKNNQLLNDHEYYYLLASLIEAVPYISNISGTFGAYLKKWDKRTQQPLQLKEIEVVNNYEQNKSYNDDANELIKNISGHILYIDPPYNSRQYISNYHVLETIARYDNPSIYGVTGLRPYSEEKSLYCNKKSIETVFEDLIKNAKFKHLIVSYSSDGILSEQQIENILKKYGIASSYKLYKFPYRKYKSKQKQINNELYEYIFYIQKEADEKNGITKNIRATIQVSPKKKYIKSPLNYIGGKYKLLNQIIPLFPKSIDTFVDLFAGGFNVGININAKNVIATDMNCYVIEILKTFKDIPLDSVIEHIENRIQEFQLSKENADGFSAFRDYYNNNQNPLDLYTLICFSFNYQFRFNNDRKYNNPFGKNRSHFSEELKKKLSIFIQHLKSKNVEFFTMDFEDFDFTTLSNNDFVYCDPPYLITTGAYNDGNRGFKNWTKTEEKKLLDLLDNLDKRDIRFALSNVLTHKNKANEYLIEWSKKYNVYHLNSSYSNSSHNTIRGESDEVLVTNY